MQIGVNIKGRNTKLREGREIRSKEGEKQNERESKGKFESNINSTT